MGSIVLMAKLELDRWRTGTTDKVVHVLRDLPLRVAMRWMFGVDVGARSLLLDRNNVRAQ
jgi:cytochrome P450